MRTAGLREIRANMTEILSGKEPVLVTRRGRISGLYLPLGDADGIPQGLRRELGQVLAAHLANRLVANGRTEEEISRDFAAFRRSR